MKSIKECLLNESKELEYVSCAFNDLKDEEGLPISCKIYIEAKYADKLSKFGKDQKDNIFAHFDDDADVCY